MKKIPFAIFTLIICIFSALIFASCDTNPRYMDEPGLVTGVILSLDNLFIALGPDNSATLTATVLPADAPDPRVKWTSSNPGIAAVDQNGKVTGIADGKAAITVTTMDHNFMAQCAVTVGPVDNPVTGVTLDKTSLNIVYGDSSSLTATVSPSYATHPGVKWTSSDPDIASVSQNGTVTAKSEGKAKITVTTEDGGKTASCDITVTVTVPVTGVKLNLNSFTIAPDKSATLIAVVSPANATDKRLTWKSDSTAVTVDQNGTVSAVNSTGSAKITVSSKEDGSKKAECIVTVGGVTVTGVTLNKTSLTLAKGGQETLTATLYPDGAASTLTWISSNPTVADVNNGTVTAGNVGGSATITVSTENGGKTASCAVTVNVPVTGVSLDHTKIMLRSSSGSSIISKASMAQLSATVLPTDATNKQVTWASDNPNIATVSASGMVTGKSVGNAKITVKTVDGNKTASCNVTVYGHFVVAGESEWLDALSSISTAPDGSAGSTNVFVIEISSDFAVAGRSSPNITGDYKEVRLIGNKTMSLSSNGSLICTAANQTFIIDGTTLQGKASNDNPIVYIAAGSAVGLHRGYIKNNKNEYSGGNSHNGGVAVYGGNFTMTGGEISGNNSGGAGGGVFVSSGNFTMTDGEISGNNAGSSGGGVYATAGTFTMTGGKISGNGGDGGGVFVEYYSDFRMTGGEISGNNADIGGGVFVNYYSNFTMDKGKISGNSGNGGGVYVNYYSDFTMNNGEISGNTAVNAPGGGVFVDDNCDFTMTGGEISGNTAINASGGGVFVYGTFTMSNGVIYGSDADASLKNKADTGAAVYKDGNIKENTIYTYP